MFHWQKKACQQQRVGEKKRKRRREDRNNKINKHWQKNYANTIYRELSGGRINQFQTHYVVSIV